MSWKPMRRLRDAALLSVAMVGVASVVGAPAATAADDTPPTVPQNLRANGDRPGNPVLVWDAASDNSGRISHYWVVVDGQQRARPAAPSYATETLVDLGRISPGVHKITIQAVDPAFNRSGHSAAIEITVAG